MSAPAASEESLTLLAELSTDPELLELSKLLVAVSNNRRRLEAADERYSDAARSRDAAVTALNNSQNALDKVLAELRSKAPRGSSWQSNSHATSRAT